MYKADYCIYNISLSDTIKILKNNLFKYIILENNYSKNYIVIYLLFSLYFHILAPVPTDFLPLLFCARKEPSRLTIFCRTSFTSRFIL